MRFVPAEVCGCEVRTASGLVEGRLGEGVWEFLGIPYAAPPIGDARLTASQEVAQFLQGAEDRRTHQVVGADIVQVGRRVHGQGCGVFAAGVGARFVEGAQVPLQERAGDLRASQPHRKSRSSSRALKTAGHTR